MIATVHMVLIRKHPLLAFREANALSQQQAADLVKITQPMWSLLEAGKAFASPAVANRIAELTGIDRDSLLNWSDDNGTASNAGAQPNEA